MLFFRRRPTFDPELLSSIWVMACRDDSPVVTAFSIAFRLSDISADEVMELVKGRRELFRVGLSRGQSRKWKEQFRKLGPDGQPATDPPADEGHGRKEGKEGEAPKRIVLPDWLGVFDDEGTDNDKQQVKQWLGDDKIASSKQALARFLDGGFVLDDYCFRSQFRVDPELATEPSDLPTVSWGLEHIDRLRRGHAESRQSWIALFTGISGVAIGAFVALTAPMLTTLYQGRPVDTARLTIDHQTLLTGYGALGTAVAGAERAAKAGDDKTLAGALAQIEDATAGLMPVVDRATRKTLQDAQGRALDRCAASDPPAAHPPSAPCLDAVEGLQRLLAGPLAEIAAQ